MFLFSPSSRESGFFFFFFFVLQEFLSFRDYFRNLVYRYFKWTASPGELEFLSNLKTRESLKSCNSIFFERFLIPLIVSHAIKEVRSREFQLEVEIPGGRPQPKAG